MYLVMLTAKGGSNPGFSAGKAVATVSVNLYSTDSGEDATIQLLPSFSGMQGQAMFLSSSQWGDAAVRSVSVLYTDGTIADESYEVTVTAVAQEMSAGSSDPSDWATIKTTINNMNEKVSTIDTTVASVNSEVTATNATVETIRQTGAKEVSVSSIASQMAKEATLKGIVVE